MKKDKLEITFLDYLLVAVALIAFAGCLLAVLSYPVPVHLVLCLVLTLLSLFYQISRIVLKWLLKDSEE